ncbi:hypothetical protein ARMSODRAFT_953893 [Armillaria solidipes]|uniref:Uncharacterized protein n=1 Tax=Armillaria solidipes TaxID=1076256 RepID=A0A2H3BZ02_9AGAR|nr:hypothetical protein ARMSODRAFT_953893 [Armillaria solidipes]
MSIPIVDEVDDPNDGNETYPFTLGRLPSNCRIQVLMVVSTDNSHSTDFPQALKVGKWTPTDQLILVDLPCKHKETGFTKVDVSAVLRPPICVTPFFQAVEDDIRRFSMFYNASTFQKIHTNPECPVLSPWDQIIVVAHSQNRSSRLADMSEAWVEGLSRILTQFS